MRVENNILIPELARLLNEKKEVRFTPSGMSMRPFIEGDKDSVILAAFDREPRVGDIVLAQTRNDAERKIYVLHRLVNIRRTEAETVYILQGDGNLMGEEICDRKGIIGYVKRIENPAGRRKPLTSGRLWHGLFPCRPFLLKIYRHTILKWYY